MTPCNLNLLITSITNHLYATLPREDFFNLSVFVNMLSKNMNGMNIMEDLCRIERYLENKGKDENCNNCDKKEAENKDGKNKEGENKDAKEEKKGKEEK